MGNDESPSLETLFDEARLLGGAARDAFLAASCAGDESLRRRLEAMLVAHEGGDAFLESSPLIAPDSVADLLTETPGDAIGPYTLIELIGEGGFGNVYLAEQSNPVRRRVALKIIKLGMDTRQVIARFEQERQALAMMNHPNIARVFDAGATATGRPYFVMEFVDGAPITDFCDRQNLTMHERLHLFIEVCHAVQHAHQKGLIHRDLKPSNVLVTQQDGRPVPKIIDFGIAKATAARDSDQTALTAFEQFIGTPEYMSPEQANGSSGSGNDIDTRSDIYSLGVLLYELLTGTTPFEERHLRSAAFDEIRRIIGEEEPPKPSARLSALGDRSMSIAAQRRTLPTKMRSAVRGDLDWIVMKALEKERARRYTSATEFASDIERHLRSEPVIAGPPSRAYRLRKFVRRNRGAVAAGGVIAAALVAAAIVSATFGVREARHRMAAEESREIAERQRESAKESEARAHAEAARAEAEAERARLAESEAERRAAELQQVADFHAAMVSRIDADVLGRQILNEQRRLVEAGLQRRWVDGEDGAMRLMSDEEIAVMADDLARLTAWGNPTDLARAMIESAILKPAIDAIERDVADQPLVAARLRSSVGRAYRSLGMLREAEPHFRRAVTDYRAWLDEDHPMLAVALHDLAVLLGELGLDSEARPVALESLEIRRRVFGEHHSEVATSLDMLASHRVKAGDLAEAESLYRQALAIRRGMFGDEHPTVAQSLNGLAELFRIRSDHASAEPLYREALDIYARSPEENRRRVLTTYNNLAGLLYSRGDYSQAEAMFREALMRARELYGDNHPMVATILNNVAMILKNRGDLDGAEVTYTDALAIYRRVYGPEHPDVARVLNNLATLLRTRGDTIDLSPLYRESIDVYRRTLGDQHSELAQVLNNFAVYLRQKGDLAAAEPLYRQSLAILRRLFGDDNRLVAGAMSNLAALLHAAGNDAESETFHQQAIEIARRALGENHTDLAYMLRALGNMLRATGRSEEAEARFRESHQIFLRSHGPEHPRTISELFDLVKSLVEIKRFAEAEPLALACYNGCVRRYGVEDSRATATGDLIVALYEGWHEADSDGGFDLKAASWRERIRAQAPENGGIRSEQPPH